MSEEDKIGSEIREGLEAAQILESTIFQKAFSTYEQELLQAWQQTAVKAQEDREILYLQTKLLLKVKINLESLMVTGKLAQKELKRLQEKQNLMPNFLRS